MVQYINSKNFFSILYSQKSSWGKMTLYDQLATDDMLSLSMDINSLFC